MASDIPLDNQRPAEYIFEKQVKESLEKIREEEQEDEDEDGDK